MKRVFALALVCALIMVTAICANAESAIGYVRSTTMNIYSSTSTHAKVLRVMCKGQKVTVTAVKSGWCRLENASGQIGYCKASSLSKTNPSAGKCWIIDDVGCPVHTSSGKTVSAYYGQCFTFVKTDGAKTYICNGKGEVGYVDSKCVTRSNPYTRNTLVYAQTSGEILYKKAYGKSDVVSVSKNAPLTLVSLSPEQFWCAVLYKGKIYYTHPTLLDTSKAPSAGSVYAVTGNEAVFASPKWSAKVVANLKKGDLVRLVGYSKQFGAKVITTDGITGYLSALPIKHS